MGYFDSLAEGQFKKDISDNTLFYPWGIFGSGFIVESEEKSRKIRSFVKKIHMITLSIIIIIQIVVGFWLNVIFLLLYYLFYYFAVKIITKDLVVSDEKLRILESYKNAANACSFPILIFLEIGSVIFVLSGFWILISDRSPLIGYAAIGFFGLCAVAFGYMILAKINSKPEAL